VLISGLNGGVKKKTAKKGMIFFVFGLKPNQEAEFYHISHFPNPGLLKSRLNCRNLSLIRHVARYQEIHKINKSLGMHADVG